MRENLVLTWAYARAYVHPSVQAIGDGEGSPKATRPGEENVVFCWREIVRYVWATSAAKRLFDSVEVSNVKKKSNIYRWKKKFQRILRCLLGVKTSSSLPVLLRTRSVQRLSSQHFAAVPTPNITELVPSCFFVSTTDGFWGGPNTFSQKNTRLYFNRPSCDQLTAGLVKNEHFLCQHCRLVNWLARSPCAPMATVGSHPRGAKMFFSVLFFFSFFR